MNINVYTDGGSSPNPGVGGYGVTMMMKGEVIEASQGYELTTNNRMELMGAINGIELAALYAPIKGYYGATIVIHTDSKYVVDSINKGWLEGWKRNNFKQNTPRPVKNIDLFKKLDILAQEHTVEFVLTSDDNDNVLRGKSIELSNECRGSDLIIDENYIKF